MSESVGDKLRRNTRATLLAWVWGQGLNFVRMMVLIYFLDTEGYGLWVFAFSIITYFFFYNVGLNDALVKYTAECTALRDYERLSGLLSTGMAVGLLMGGGVLAFLAGFTDEAIAFFNVSSDNEDAARFVVLGVGVASALTLAFGVYSAALIGLQRLDINNACRVGTMTLDFMLTVGALSLGYGIRALVTVYTLGIVVYLVVIAIIVARLLPEVRIRPWLARWRYLRAIAALGGKMQALGTVALLVSQLDILLFMRYGGPAFVGAYGAAQKFAQRAQGAALQGFGALAPASADMMARQDHDTLGRVYTGALRLVAVGCAYLFAFTAINSDAVMHFVMGDKFEPIAAYTLVVLSIGYFVHTLTGPGSSMLRGAGMPLREMAYQSLVAVCFVALYLFLRESGDGRTIITLWPVSLIAGSLVFMVLANRFFGVGLASPFFNMLLPLVAAPLLAAAVRLLWEVAPLPAPDDRWTALAAILALGAVYTPLYLAAAWCLPGLTVDDKSAMVRFIPRGERLLGRLGLAVPAPAAKEGRL